MHQVSAAEEYWHIYIYEVDDYVLRFNISRSLLLLLLFTSIAFFLILTLHPMTRSAPST